MYLCVVDSDDIFDDLLVISWFLAVNSFVKTAPYVCILLASVAVPPPCLYPDRLCNTHFSPVVGKNRSST